MIATLNGGPTGRYCPQHGTDALALEEARRPKPRPGRGSGDFGEGGAGDGGAGDRGNGMTLLGATWPSC